MIPLRLPLYIRRIPCCGKSFRIEAFLLCFIRCTKQYPLAFYHLRHPVWARTSKFVRWERETRYYVPSTLCILSLSPSSRNTLHTDRAHKFILEVSTLLNVQVLSRLNALKIKTRKLLGDYSSENSECNRRELRTLEIHFLESV